VAPPIPWARPCARRGASQGHAVSRSESSTRRRFMCTFLAIDMAEPGIAARATGGGPVPRPRCGRKAPSGRHARGASAPCQSGAAQVALSGGTGQVERPPKSTTSAPARPARSSPAVCATACAGSRSGPPRSRAAGGSARVLIASYATVGRPGVAHECRLAGTAPALSSLEPGYVICSPAGGDQPPALRSSGLRRGGPGSWSTIRVSVRGAVREKARRGSFRPS
jgi:hypothetical protein